MRILKLELLNLASLDNPEGEVIDFNEGILGDSSIFSIVGAMGSGKSTILDAICLALYNRAPRYPRKKGDRNQHIDIMASDSKDEGQLAPTDSRNILTRGRKIGYSKLTFVANNGSVYRAEWHVRLKRTVYDNVKTFLYRIYVEDGKQIEESVAWDDIPKIIGLEFEQFLRTVLIAQGSFAAFLKAKDEERYELLEKLIGGEEVYIDLAAKIFENRNKALEAFKNIKSKLAAYEGFLIGEDDLKELEENIAKLDADACNRQKEISELTLQIDWYKQYELLEDKIKKLSADYDIIKAEEIDLKPLREKLIAYENATDGINTLLEFEKINSQINEIKIQIDSKGLEKENIEKKLKEAEQEVSVNRQNVESIKTEKERSEPIIRLGRQYGIEITGLTERYKEVCQSKEKIQHELKKAVESVADNKNRIDDLKKEFIVKKELHNKLLSEIKESERKAAERKEKIETLLQEERSKIKGLDGKQLRDLKSEADAVVNTLSKAITVREAIEFHKDKIDADEKNILLAEHENKSLSDKLKDNDYKDLKADIESLERSLTLIKSENVENLRSSLSKDTPCPVCGSLEHPYCTVSVISQAVAGVESMLFSKKILLEKRITSEKEIISQTERNRGIIDTLRNSIKDSKKELDKQLEEWSGLLNVRKRLSENVILLKTELATAIDNQLLANGKLEYFIALDESIKKLQLDYDKEREEYRILIDSNNSKRGKSEECLISLNSKIESEERSTPIFIEIEQGKRDELEAIELIEKSISEQLQAKKKLLKELLPDTTPDRFEADLKKRLEETNGNLDIAVEKYNNDFKVLNTLSGNISALNNTVNKNVEESDRLKATLDLWLCNFNKGRGRSLAMDDLRILAHDKCDWVKVRNDLRSYDDRCSAVAVALQTETDNLKNMSASHPLDDPQVLNDKIQALQQFDDTPLIQAKIKVKAHKEAVEVIGDIKSEYDDCLKAADDWKSIADSIGADGKILRKIAQTYTLRFLIQHANEEIRKFNTRYELVHVKNSLGMRVIDHDRGDDIRDLTTLSGGETFIVSLGLALGLSSLSSKNVSFDNLFIDEGFGSLDADTLSTVIDSLAMLQMRQGKKVGIISHTDAMSERISTQIRIVKNGNSGSSRIEIVSGGSVQ